MSTPALRFRQRHNVMIVDDNDDIRDAIGMVLALEGYDVAGAESAAEAFRRLRAGFDACVVLLDLHMPGTDGWGFLDRMRMDPHLDDVAVVIVSGDADKHDEAVAAGYEFLLKPIRPDTLLGAIARHCRRHRH
jgi:CheY-like chemotaxis protein